MLLAGLALLLPRSAAITSRQPRCRGMASLVAMDLSRARALLNRVNLNNQAGAVSRATKLKFVVGREVLGYVLPRFARLLRSFPDVFEVSDEVVALIDHPTWLGLPKEALVAARSNAVARTVDALRAADSVPCLRGWRDELYAVSRSLHEEPELLVERAAAPLFGRSVRFILHFQALAV